MFYSGSATRVLLGREDDLDVARSPSAVRARPKLAMPFDITLRVGGRAVRRALTGGSEERAGGPPGLEPCTLDRRPEPSMTRVFAARERMCALLEPHLGAADALERANNIAQFLLLDDRDPHASVRTMLRVLTRDLQASLADQICQTWRGALA